MVKFCQKCADNKHDKNLCFHGYYWTYMDYVRTCNVCGGTFIDIDFPNKDLRDLIEVTNNLEFIKYMMELYKTDIVEYESKMVSYREQAARIYQKENEDFERKTGQTASCPNCKSIRIKKISTTRRLFSVGFWGLGSDKIGKTYECLNCGYKW